MANELTMLRFVRPTITLLLITRTSGPKLFNCKMRYLTVYTAVLAVYKLQDAANLPVHAVYLPVLAV